ncbi:hypothetical protein L1987_33408 [Smallanthus sonchifolius]|uniref:Uncharacterized protein n=1 Tax=Smallanthus sonchifolius TaxID=185202 RepID=A0ACB9HR03_9ASTR|nr:hypothetical protein L1987_33408 [Smallanthus sonchifolius]
MQKVNLGGETEQGLWSTLSALLASTHIRCTSLVCSCYVPSRSNKGETKEVTNNKSVNTKRSSPSLESTSNKDHHHHHDHHHGILKDIHVYANDHEAKINDVINRSRININGGMEGPSTPTPLKSNLKKSSIVHQKVDQLTMEIRRVSWPDDHGKDIAHVQEFVPSVSDEEELGVVRNSCVCVIL